MSDSLVIFNRRQMKLHFGIRVGCGLEITRGSNGALSAILQALFACEEFRIKIILLAPHYQTPPLYSNIRDLFEHMIVAKQAFLIPTGITETFRDLNQNDLIVVLERMLKFIRNMYMSGATHPADDNEVLPNCSTDSFYMKFTYKCKNQCSHVRSIAKSNNMWFAKLEIGNQPQQQQQQQQPINIQKELRKQLFHIHSRKRCPNCNEKIECVWNAPNALIIHLSHQSQINDIESIVRVLDQQYSIFAFICHETQNIYSCYAKLDRMWYCFKGRDVSEVLVLTQLSDVCVLFYKKVPTDDYSYFIRAVDAFGVIPPLELPAIVSEHLRLQEMKNSFKSEKYSVNDIIANDEDYGIIRTGLRNIHGICFMNSTLQALFYCRVFRKYILECDKQLGAYHTHLRDLFAAMSSRNREAVTESHERLWVLFEPNLTKRNNLVFFSQLIKFLHKEIQAFSVNRGLTLYAHQTRKFETTIDGDYANVVIGREDMSSSIAWMRYMIENDSSYVHNMFSSQQLSQQRCRCGHKLFLNFNHSQYVSIPRLRIQFQSLQSIVDHFKSAFALYGNTCDRCTQTQTTFNAMFQYKDLCIYRASDILVFDLISLISFIDNKLHKTDMIIDETLYVCGEEYRCVALNTYIEGHMFSQNTTGFHTTTYARCDDHLWWLFDDSRVVLLHDGLMPQNCDLDHNQCIFIAYYERKSNLISFPLRTRITRMQPTMTLEDIGIRDVDIQATRVRLLTLLSSTVGLSGVNGNTSYMNSVLQCLYHCFEFRKYIVFNQKSYDWTQTHYLLKWLFVNLTCTDYPYIDPKQFWLLFTKKHPKLSKTRENDPKKFISAMIVDLLRECYDGLEESADLEIETILNDSWNAGMCVPFGSNNANLNIIDMFAVIFRTEMYCKSGLHFKVRFEQQYILEFECNTDSLDVQSIQSLVNRHFMHYFKSELIQCWDCGYEAVMHSTLQRVPNILIVLLNIFQYNSSIDSVVRIDHKIQINANIIINGEQLSLRSCVCCNGFKPFSFHYYSYAKCDDNTTLCFNDMYVKRGKRMKIPSIYILFYEKL